MANKKEKKPKGLVTPPLAGTKILVKKVDKKAYPETTLSRFPKPPFETKVIKSVPGRAVLIRSDPFKVLKKVPGETSKRAHTNYKFMEMYPDQYTIVT